MKGIEPRPFDRMIMMGGAWALNALVAEWVIRRPKAKVVAKTVAPMLRAA